MPPPPPRKPAPPVSAPAAAATTKSGRPPKREAFIGNDSQTMMSDETFAEFEARMKAEEGAAGATNTNPAHEAADDDDLGDEEDLGRLGKFLQAQAHRIGHRTADTAVHLIEDERSGRGGLRQHHFDGEGETGQLAA